MISVSNNNLSLQGKQQGRNTNSVLDNRGKKHASFGTNEAVVMSTLTKGLEYFNQHPIAEVAFLDVTTMVAPRTTIDYQQNPVYGTETLFREVAPIVFNPFGPGIVAAIMMNHKGFNGITAGKDTVLSLHDSWKAAGGQNLHPTNMPKEQQSEIVKKYMSHVLENAVGTAQNRPFNKLSKEELNELSGKLTDLALNSKDKKAAKKLSEEIAEKFTSITGSAKLKLKPEHDFSTDIHSLVNDVVSVGKKFVQTLPENRDTVVKEIAGFSKKKTLWGTGLSIAGLISLPYINNTITKLRTGKSGYAAYKDFGKDDNCSQEKPDKSRLWKAKAVGMGIIGTIMLTTMGAFKKDKGFFGRNGLKNFMNTIELKGKSAHMDLIKLIYGASLMSRVFFSRDEQEVKNTTLRDSCGFLNWLVLGGFVAKGVAHLADRKGGSFVNITGPIKDNSKNSFVAAFKTVGNWLSNVSLKTHSEMRAMNVPASIAKKNMLIHTGAILSGLAWSMFALGIGMPLLNNHMTNKAREKQLKQKEKQSIKIADIDTHKQGHPSFFSNTSIKNEKSFSDFVNQFKN